MSKLALTVIQVFPRDSHYPPFPIAALSGVPNMKRFKQKSTNGPLFEPHCALMCSESCAKRWVRFSYGLLREAIRPSLYNPNRILHDLPMKRILQGFPIKGILHDSLIIRIIRIILGYPRKMPAVQGSKRLQRASRFPQRSAPLKTIREKRGTITAL